MEINTIPWEACKLAWCMVLETQNRDEGEQKSACSVSLNVLLRDGQDLCKQPGAIGDWIRCINECVEKLIGYGMSEDSIADTTVQVVLTMLKLKTGEEWQSWRLLARETKKDMRNQKTPHWHTISSALRDEYFARFGQEAIINHSMTANRITNFVTRMLAKEIATRICQRELL